MNCANCGHSKEVHDYSDSWGMDTGEEDETWTNDGCSECKIYLSMPKCLHFEEEKK